MGDDKWLFVAPYLALLLKEAGQSCLTLYVFLNALLCLRSRLKSSRRSDDDRDDYKL